VREIGERPLLDAMKLLQRTRSKITRLLATTPTPEREQPLDSKRNQYRHKLDELLLLIPELRKRAASRRLGEQARAELLSEVLALRLSLLRPSKPKSLLGYQLDVAIQKAKSATKRDDLDAKVLRLEDHMSTTDQMNSDVVADLDSLIALLKGT
jgi:hypothetical protein